jgi:hypothetical protein
VETDSNRAGTRPTLVGVRRPVFMIILFQILNILTLLPNLLDLLYILITVSVNY